MMKPSLSDRAVAATYWGVLELLVRYGGHLIVTVILARVLQPEEFGVLAMILVFTGVGATLAEAGFGYALIQKQNASITDETTVFWICGAIGVSVGLLVWFISPWVEEFYKQDGISELLRVCAIIIPIASLQVVPDSILRKALDFRRRAISELTATVPSAIIAIVLAQSGWGIWSLVAQVMILSTLRAWAFWYFTGWRPVGGISKAAVYELGGYGSFILGSNLLDIISIRLQSLLLGRNFGAEILGHYSIAQTIQQAPTTFVGMLLRKIGFPVMARVGDNSYQIKETLRQALGVAMFVFFPAMVGLSLLSIPIVYWIFGAKWLPAAPILTLLALSAVFWPLHVLNVCAIAAVGRGDLYFRLEVVKKAFTVGGISIAAQFGGIEVAATLLAISIINVAVNSWYAGTLFEYGIGRQLYDQIGTIIFTAIAAGIGAVVVFGLGYDLSSLLLAIVASASSYCYLGYSFKDKNMKNFIRFVRSAGLVKRKS